jgi:hypothetical protein
VDDAPPGARSRLSTLGLILGKIGAPLSAEVNLGRVLT